MRKNDHKLLKKVLISETRPEVKRLPVALPFLSDSEEYERLERKGYVKKVSVVLPGDLSIRINGWALTDLGRSILKG